ncbi:RNA 2',3'-cyclic phosphodiesterase [bacterium]|nr:MAG: RNA 2',3'-cyclic phosphodiesterase [bacterium]
MRTFIAIELGNPIKDALSRLQSELNKSEADVKWVLPENIHLTLKFLGEVKEEEMPEIIQSLKKIAREVNSFRVEINAIGAFPNAKSPRVIWSGIEQGKENLSQLAGLVEDALERLEFPREERKFSAHITIGRVRSPKNRAALSEAMQQLKFDALSQTVKSIILFKSSLTPKGPIYEKLDEENLKSSS